MVVRELKSGKELHLPIIIRPPFYASVYAYIVYVVIVLCILFWLYRFNRSRRLLKQSLQREHEEKLQVEKANQMKLNSIRKFRMSKNSFDLNHGSTGLVIVKL